MRTRLFLSLGLVLVGLTDGSSARPALQASGDGCTAVVISDYDKPPPFFLCKEGECNECFTIGGDEGMECWCSPIGPYPNCCHMTYFPMNPPSMGFDVSGTCQPIGGCFDNGGVCILVHFDMGGGDSSHFAKCKRTIGGN